MNDKKFLKPLYNTEGDFQKKQTTRADSNSKNEEKNQKAEIHRPQETSFEPNKDKRQKGFEHGAPDEVTKPHQKPLKNNSPTETDITHPKEVN